jgi:hypothetical protein
MPAFEVAVAAVATIDGTSRKVLRPLPNVTAADESAAITDAAAAAADEGNLQALLRGVQRPQRASFCLTSTERARAGAIHVRWAPLSAPDAPLDLSDSGPSRAIGVDERLLAGV